MIISIHVPSWGTTLHCSRHWRNVFISIHVPSWGTTSAQSGIATITPFQSTFPRGERHGVTSFLCLCIYFNPRSLVGNDDSCLGGRHHQSISIHVPSWGTTDNDFYLHHTYKISIHVPSWGTTQQACYIIERLGISIHVPSWGTTRN